MKIKINGLFLSMLLFSINSFSQNLKEFKITLEECGMEVDIPVGFKECKIIDNADMEYEYAIKYPKKDFELRYAIRPITYKSYLNDTIRKDFENLRPFRNSQYKTVLQTVILNLTSGVDFPTSDFDKDAVNKEFNADWGATSFVQLKSEFGKGYKYCMIVAIHKHDVADAYYFYLSNSKDGFSENMDPLFHSLRFKKK